MTIDELKSAIKNLTIEERRKIALYILELEKDHLQGTVGPQLKEDLEGLSRVLQETFEKVRKHVKNGL